MFGSCWGLGEKANLRGPKPTGAGPRGLAQSNQPKPWTARGPKADDTVPCPDQSKRNGGCSGVSLFSLLGCGGRERELSCAWPRKGVADGTPDGTPKNRRMICVAVDPMEFPTDRLANYCDNPAVEAVNAVEVTEVEVLKEEEVEGEVIEEAERVSDRLDQHGMWRMLATWSKFGDIDADPQRARMQELLGLGEEDFFDTGGLELDSLARQATEISEQRRSGQHAVPFETALDTFCTKAIGKAYHHPHHHGSAGHNHHRHHAIAGA